MKKWVYEKLICPQCLKTEIQLAMTVHEEKGQ